MIDTNEYSVPIEYKSREVEIYKAEKHLYIYDGKRGSQLACHEIPLLTGQRVINRDHFRNKILPIKELRSQILKLHDFKSWKEFVEINTDPV